jgi:hypothetical protein
MMCQVAVYTTLPADTPKGTHQPKPTGALCDAGHSSGFRYRHARAALLSPSVPPSSVQHVLQGPQMPSPSMGVAQLAHLSVRMPAR